MKRRAFLLSGSVSVAAAVTGCGGGGGATDLAAGAAASSPPTPVTPDGSAAVVAKQRPPVTSPPGTTSTSTSSTSTTTTTTTTTTGAGALGYAFGARLVAYPYGTKPSASNSTMDALLKQQYDAWKAARIVSANSVVAGGYADQFSNTQYLTVSEGMGYAMLLAVLFAGHDPNAQQLFDGLLAVARTRYAYAVAQYDPNGKYLMDWQLWADGSSAGAGWSACDGDLDIALSLLMADKQWGSSGTSWNYRQEALNTIGALKSWNFDATTAAVGGRGVSHPGSARISDYMFGHFRAFKAATGDTFWDLAVTTNQSLMDYLQRNYSPSAGLLPDWAVNVNTGTPQPSPGYIGDGTAQEGDYWWNSCRDPWRLGTDYVLSGDANTGTICGRLVNFFQSQVAAAAGDVTVIGTGYDLSGNKLTGGNDAAYMAPIMLGACMDTKYQTFVDALWNWNASRLTTGYYDSEIQLLSMVVASGNWWSPPPSGAAATTTTSTSSGTGTSSATTSTTGTASATNLVVNGDFSNGLTSWSNWGNSIVVNGALNVGSAAGGAGQDVWTKLTAGANYQLTATANVTVAGTEGVFVGVKLMDGAGAVLVDQTQLVSATAPTPVAIAFVAPQGVASGYVYVWKNANTAVGVVDNVSLVPA